MRVTPSAAIPVTKFANRRPNPVAFGDFMEELSKKAYVVQRQVN